MATIETREVTRTELMREMAACVAELADRYQTDAEKLARDMAGGFARILGSFERDGAVAWWKILWVRKPSAEDALRGLPHWP